MTARPIVWTRAGQFLWLLCCAFFGQRSASVARSGIQEITLPGNNGPLFDLFCVLVTSIFVALAIALFWSGHRTIQKMLGLK